MIIRKHGLELNKDKYKIKKGYLETLETNEGDCEIFCGSNIKIVCGDNCRINCGDHCKIICGFGCKVKCGNNCEIESGRGTIILGWCGKNNCIYEFTKKETILFRYGKFESKTS